MAGIRYKAQIWDCLKPYDVTPEQWVILNKLFDEDGISQRELAQRVAKNHPNTTRRITSYNVCYTKLLRERDFGPE